MHVLTTLKNVIRILEALKVFARVVFLRMLFHEFCIRWPALSAETRYLIRKTGEEFKVQIVCTMNCNISLALELLLIRTLSLKLTLPRSMYHPRQSFAGLWFSLRQHPSLLAASVAADWFFFAFIPSHHNL